MHGKHDSQHVNDRSAHVAVLGVLQDGAPRSTTEFYRTIAEYTPAEVYRALRDLVEMGVLVAERGDDRVLRYTLAPPDEPDDDPGGSDSPPVDERLALVARYLSGKVEPDDMMTPEEAQQLKGVERLLAQRVSSLRTAIALSRSGSRGGLQMGIHLLISTVNEVLKQPLKMSYATIGKIFSRDRSSVEDAVNGLRALSSIIVRHTGDKAVLHMWAAIPRDWRDEQDAEFNLVIRAAIGPSWVGWEPKSIGVIAYRSDQSVGDNTHRSDQSVGDNAYRSKKPKSKSVGVNAYRSGQSVGVNPVHSSLSSEESEEEGERPRTDERFAKVEVRDEHLDRLMAVWTERAQALEQKPPTLHAVTCAIEAALRAALTRHPDVSVDEVAEHLPVAILQCAQADKNIGGFLKTALEREVAGALKAKKAKRKERSSRDTPPPPGSAAPPPPPPVPERWAPIETMIRAHANHGFVRRDDLAAVITATIAALEAVEDVEDVDIATLATWTPINRDGSRTTMWTPAEFGENLAIVTKNRRLAEYAARVEPWFRTNFEADEGGQALLALSADEQRALRTSEVHGSDAYRWALVAVRKYYGNFPGLSDTKPAPTLDDLIHAAAEQSARNEEAQRHGN